MSASTIKYGYCASEEKTDLQEYLFYDYYL